MVVDAAGPEAESESMTSRVRSPGLFRTGAMYLASLIFVGVSFGSSAAAEKDKELSGGPYCGIYNVYAALRSYHLDVDFEKLIDDKYIGSASGSSLAELQKAVQDFGARAQPVEGLTASSLRVAQNPIILHVRQPGFDSPYSHWVLFLGMEGDKARIVDPPNEVEPLPIDQVMAMTDGTGLAVSNEAPDVWIMSAASWVENGTLLFGAFLVVGAANILFSGWKKPKSRTKSGLIPRLALGAGRLITLAALAGLIGICWRLWCGNGRLYDADALALVVDRHFHADVPVVSLADVAASVNKPGVIIVDARLPRDYEAGHIPGAINFPISAGWIDGSRLLAGVPRGNRVIVYCQSESCTWSTEVASDIAFRGFTNVSVYHGGWVEWYQHEYVSHGS
jgi:rhodanese-related sulfurtransferase